MSRHLMEPDPELEVTAEMLAACVGLALWPIAIALWVVLVVFGGLA